MWLSGLFELNEQFLDALVARDPSSTRVSRYGDFEEEDSDRESDSDERISPSKLNVMENGRSAEFFRSLQTTDSFGSQDEFDVPSDTLANTALNSAGGGADGSLASSGPALRRNTAEKIATHHRTQDAPSAVSASSAAGDESFTHSDAAEHREAEGCTAPVGAAALTSQSITASVDFTYEACQFGVENSTSGRFTSSADQI